MGLLRAYAIWPDARWPMEVVDLGSPEAARWLRDTFAEHAPSATLGRLVSRRQAATIAALRARSLLIGAPGSLLIETAERALGRPLRDPRPALYSPTGMRISKVIHFVFERGGHEPSLAIASMAERDHSERLRSETETVESVRDRLEAAPELAAALPLKPLLAETVAGEYLVAMPVDPLAGATGGNCRDDAIEWLRRFQAVTSPGGHEGTAAEHERELAALRRAWDRLRPDRAQAVVDRTAQLLQPLRGSSAPVCVVHGDYWRGNIARGDGGRLRIFDWECSEPEGHPALDLLGFEIGEARHAIGALEDRQLAEALAGGVRRAERELEGRGIEPGAAPALLAPAVGRLVERSHRMVGGRADPLLRMMVATESVLGA